MAETMNYEQCRSRRFASGEIRRRMAETTKHAYHNRNELRNRPTKYNLRIITYEIIKELCKTNPISKKVK